MENLDLVPEIFELTDKEMQEVIDAEYGKHLPPLVVVDRGNRAINRAAVLKTLKVLQDLQSTNDAIDVVNQMLEKSVTVDPEYLKRIKDSPTGRIYEEIPELQDPRFTGRLTSNKSNLKSVSVGDEKPVEHNKVFDINYAEMELKVFASLSKEKQEEVLQSYYTIDSDLVNISAQYVSKVQGKWNYTKSNLVHKANLGFDFEDKVRHIGTEEIGIVVSQADPNYTIGVDEVMVTDSIGEVWAWPTDSIEKAD